MDLNSRADARVVANVDVRTDGKLNPYMVACLRQVRQKFDHFCKGNNL